MDQQLCVMQAILISRAVISTYYSEQIKPSTESVRLTTYIYQGQTLANAAYG